MGHNGPLFSSTRLSLLIEDLFTQLHILEEVKIRKRMVWKTFKENQHVY